MRQFSLSTATWICSLACLAVLSFMIALPNIAHALIKVNVFNNTGYTVPVGGVAILYADATSSLPISYQWQRFHSSTKSWSNIQGATSSFLFFSSATPSDSNSYRTVLTDADGTVNTGSQFINVTSDPTRISNMPKFTGVTPTSVTIGLNGSVSMRVDGVTNPDNTPLNYQWYHNNRPILGAKAASYTIPSIAASQAGHYRVSIENSSGRVFTKVIPVTIFAHSSIAPTIIAEPAPKYWWLIERPFTISAGVLGDAPLSYQWFKNGAPIAGATQGSFSLSKAVAGDVGNYHVQVTNPHGTATSRTFELVVGQPPEFQTYPAPRNSRPSGEALTLQSLAVDKTYGNPVTYQWFKNGGAMNGVTTPNLTFNSLKASDAGGYSVQAFNGSFAIRGPESYVEVVDNHRPGIRAINGRFTYILGEPVNITAETFGNAVRYEWRNVTTDAVVSTTPTLAIAKSALADSGSYTFTVHGEPENDSPYAVTQLVNLQVMQRPSASNRLTADKLALVINTRDPYSVEVGAYYVQRRKIPTQNIIYVDIPTNQSLTAAEFAAFDATLKSKLTPTHQAIALAWKFPAYIQCSSITGAVSRGLNLAPCSNLNQQSLNTQPPNPMYNSKASLPFTTHGIRPSMMLAAHTVQEAKALIDRGVKSNGTMPRGVAYHVITTDATRSIRSSNMYYTLPNMFQNRGHKNVSDRLMLADSLRGYNNVMWYFTGSTHVAHLSTNRYLPGAVADTYTSISGLSQTSSQMTFLDFISAGLTGSYGNVSEPFAINDKFPNTDIMVRSYSSGDTLIEAYWKSVRTTYQGQFIGEPLAAPYAPALFEFSGGPEPVPPIKQLKTPAAKPGVRAGGTEF
jgi:uncharacterized protein (TIGR03790 family)